MGLVWFRARKSLAAIAVVACLIVAACSSSPSNGATATSAPPADDPTATYSGPGTLHAIEATTVLHLQGVSIGVGNIWEEEHTPAGGTSRRGLTAMLFINVESDASQNHDLRVHPGQELTVPGYRLHVVSVEERHIQLVVVDEAE